MQNKLRILLFDFCLIQAQSVYVSLYKISLDSFLTGFSVLWPILFVSCSFSYIINALYLLCLSVSAIIIQSVVNTCLYTLFIFGVFVLLTNITDPLAGIGNLLAVILFPVLIYYCQMGVTGAAISTVMSQ